MTTEPTAPTPDVPPIDADTPEDPGTFGWWPVIAGRVADIRTGDRLDLPEDDGLEPVIVAETSIVGGVRRRIVPTVGEPFTLGLLYTPVHISRPGVHATLADSCR